MWYKSSEAQRRFSFFFSAASFAGAFGGLLASAIGKLESIRGYHAWRWIVIIEGILCCYRNIQSSGIVSSTDGQAGKEIDSPQRRTVATSITRMVIFIRAVQGLKVAYATSGANDRKYSCFVKVIFC